MNISSRPYLPVVLITLTLLAGPLAASTSNDALRMRIGSLFDSQATLLDEASRGLEPSVLTAATAMARPDLEELALKRVFHKAHQVYEGVCRVVLARLDPKLDIQAGNDFFDGFFLPEDNQPAQVRKAQDALDRLSRAACRRDLHFRAGVFTGDKLDAFTKEGELIVVSEAVVDSPPDEMAAILAHEMCHLEKRDLVRVRIFGEFNRRLAARIGSENRPACEKVLTWCARRYQRFQEYEADARSVDLLARAGCAPGGLLQVLERLGASASPMAGARRSLEGDHPSPAERLEALQKNHPEILSGPASPGRATGD